MSFPWLSIYWRGHKIYLSGVSNMKNVHTLLKDDGDVNVIIGKHRVRFRNKTEVIWLPPSRTRDCLKKLIYFFSLAEMEATIRLYLTVNTMPFKLQPVKSLKANSSIHCFVLFGFCCCYCFCCFFFPPLLSCFWFFSDSVTTSSNKTVNAPKETPHFQEQKVFYVLFVS